MSQYFSVGGQAVWNPAIRVAQLFFQTAGAMVVVTRKPHGIHDLGWDEYDIDLPTYQEFVRELTRQYLASTHAVFIPLIEGFLPTALALLRKAGGDVPQLTETVAGKQNQEPRIPGQRDRISQAERVLSLAEGLARSVSA